MSFEDEQDQMLLVSKGFEEWWTIEVVGEEEYSRADDEQEGGLWKFEVWISENNRLKFEKFRRKKNLLYVRVFMVYAWNNRVRLWKYTLKGAFLN